MRLFVWLAVAVLAIMAAGVCGAQPAGPAGAAPAAVDITVDGAARHQTIAGMGAMLYPFDKPYDAPDFPDFFARETGCSIARMEVIPAALPEEPADLDVFLSEPIDATVKRLNLTVADIKKIGDVIKPIVDHKLDVMRLIATVWSPPKWMKTNNETKNGGALRADRREHFAKYLAAYCKGFETMYGVPVYALSIQNELVFKEPYNSCQYDPKTTDYAEACGAVARALKKAGLAARLFGPENMCTDGPGGFFYEADKKFADQVMANADAAPAFIAWSYHGYAADGKTVASAAKGWTHYADLATQAKKELWMTETSGSQAAWLSVEKNKDGTTGAPNGALTMTLNLHDALVYGNLNAWVYWSFQDGNKVSEYNLTFQGDKTSKKLASARHYFRYIRPGAVRVDALPTTPDHTACAFVQEAQKTVTVILTNQTTAPEVVTVRLKNLPAGVQATKLIGFLTDEENTWKALPDIAPANGSFKIELPPSSVVTLSSAIVVLEAKELW